VAVIPAYTLALVAAEARDLAALALLVRRFAAYVAYIAVCFLQHALHILP
jgi:hypothetical protein